MLARVALKMILRKRLVKIRVQLSQIPMKINTFTTNLMTVEYYKKMSTIVETPANITMALQMMWMLFWPVMRIILYLKAPIKK